MIISRTPFRVSFFGGGTDYPEWTAEEPGAVLATTINKYCYLTTRYLPPFFEHKTRVLYSRVENVSAIDEIQHPAVRETLRYLGITEGLEIHHDGDLPHRTGLGSSSAFTVGLLNALYGLQGRMATKMELAMQAIHIEQNMIRETVGAQDQILAAFGGLNSISFNPGRPPQVQPVLIPKARLESLESHLMLFFTGFTRTASEIAKSQVAQIPNHRKELSEMYRLVAHAISLLTGHESLDEFGRLLHESWMIKRSLTDRVSTPEIDAIYDLGRAAGAIGGKLLGAGGGGFLLLFARPERQDSIRKALGKLLYVPIRFEYMGSQIIFADR